MFFFCHLALNGKPLEHKPVPLQTGEEAEYMLALKQEFRGAMKTLPFYIRPAAPKKGHSFSSLSNILQISTSDILLSKY